VRSGAWSYNGTDAPHLGAGPTQPFSVGCPDIDALADCIKFDQFHRPKTLKT